MLNKKRINPSKIKKDKSFLLKLFDILNDTTYNDIIHWNTEGNGMVIIDVEKFSNLILPKFYIHNKYTSFIRQLNIYGFHKSKNINIERDGEGYYSTKFNKNSTKEQIMQIKRKNKINRFLLNYNNKKKSDDILVENGKDMINHLLIKNRESSENLNKLLKEFEELKNINESLKESFLKIKNDFNGQNIIMTKMIKQKKENKIYNKQQNKNKKDSNLKEFFIHYLYYLGIYSPYIVIPKDINNNKSNI